MTLQSSSLWRNRDFRSFWVARTLSEFGAKIGALAIPVIAASTLHATPFQMGCVVAAETLPYLLLGLIAGSWSDRLQKRLILIIADLVRGAILLLVPLCAAMNWLNIELLFAFALLTGMAEVWFNIASAAYLPIMVEKAALIDANSKMSVSTSAAEAVAPVVAGVLIQLLSAPIALIVNALTYLLSGWFIASRRHPDDQHKTFPTQRPLIRHEILSGLRFVFGHTILRAVTFRLAAWQFIVGTTLALFVHFALNELKFSSTALGAQFSIMGAGVFCGALLSKWLNQKIGVGRSIIASTIIAALFATLIPLAAGTALMRFIMVACAMFVYGVCTTVYEVNNVSLRQSLTPTAMLGRMTATVRVSTLGLRSVGAFVGGLLGSAIGIRETLLLVLAIGAVLGLSALFISPLRSVHSLTDKTDLIPGVGNTAQPG